MKFKKFYSNLSKSEKKSLADDLKTSPAYLSQIANGHRNPGRKFILNIEEVTSGNVMPNELFVDAPNN